jgi:NitT/TauT family transport system substrate-binding protein
MQFSDLAAVVLLGGLSFGACAQSTSLAVPTLSLTFAHTFIAEDKGFWKEEGLEVKLPSIAGVGATNAVLAGSVDFTNTTAASFLRANAKGQRLVALANTLDKVQIEIVLGKEFASKFDLDPKRPAEQRGRSLKGARIAVDAVNSVVHGYVRYAARRAGLDPERDLTIAPMQPPSMLAALKAGRIDGYAMSRPWPTMATHEGLATVVVTGPGGDFPELNPFNYNLIITRPGFCVEKADVCRKLVNGLVKAMRFMQEQPNEALALLRKRFDKTEPALLEDAFRGILASTPKVPAPTEAGFRNADRFMIVGGMISEDERLGSYEGLVVERFVQ